MATLYLVRHAQASFGMDNYDELSSMGLKQSELIGQHFSKKIDALYRGDLKRQRQTAEIGFPELEASIITGLNEFDHENVISVHAGISDKVALFTHVMSQPNPKEFAENEFKVAMRKWTDEAGEQTAYNESYGTFKSRSIEALKQIIAISREQKHKEVVAITSVGVICYIMQYLLDLPLDKMVELNMAVVNTSVTAIRFNDTKISLSYFNNHSHLPDGMVTTM